MKRTSLFWVSALLLLAACGGGPRVTYSGHEESTEGVPGYVKGKKVSPTVKLGQSYSVDGETYVPRNQPDYKEEGLASWYGPGFHGGKTANGERFDKEELTGAHRTLPLPSIVRVTMLSTGKQVYVRINDRGPFSKNRIIDLSRAAAEKIGLLRAGVAKVRVEYMPKESQRFADLLAEGRDPKSIDVASEVMNYGDGESAPASQVTRVASDDGATSDSGDEGSSFWDSINKSSDGEPTQTMKSAPISEVASADLMPPKALPAAKSKIMEADKVIATESPFDAVEAPKAAPSVAVAAGGGTYVQLGAFSNETNAERLRKQFAAVEGLNISKKDKGGQTLYHVRMGPYSTLEASNTALAKAREAGADAKIIRE
ncbi:MAG: septal ring lytic transglycosylase RlpA family protein [Pseudomonadota bacterium]